MTIYTFILHFCVPLRMFNPIDFATVSMNIDRTIRPYVIQPCYSYVFGFHGYSKSPQATKKGKQARVWHNGTSGNAQDSGVLDFSEETTAPVNGMNESLTEAEVSIRSGCHG